MDISFFLKLALILFALSLCFWFRGESKREED